MLFSEDLLKRLVIILSLKFQIVSLLRHEKPVAQTIWPERCTRFQRILNDCNWCVCNDRQTFVCAARHCSEVDVFGHFNDAIREHLVGMEGHGSWRSNGTVCDAGTHYQREGLLCICNEDGNWPNPVCRDIFRVMHEVELTNKATPTDLEECVPRKLYLYGCNVCVCPSTGRIDTEVCTRNNCSDTDPVFKTNEEIVKESGKYDVGEVYAECDLNKKYTVGCRKCVCLRNNRLLCDECKSDLVSRGRKEDTYCSRNEAYKIFNIDCNFCLCDSRDKLYCTTKRCLKEDSKPVMELNKVIDITLRTVDPPLDNLDCTPGTKYRLDCNTCFCTETVNNIKTLSCTLKRCYDGNKILLNYLKTDCVENTVYEADCLICRCDVVDGVKRESCLVDSKCKDHKHSQTELQDLKDLHGYCEPAHVYSKDCNTCRCLSDGKVVMCTSRVCELVEERPVMVDIVPVSQISNKPCPANHMYKIDCNFCFCLNNGNILCTTAKCDDKDKKK